MRFVRTDAMTLEQTTLSPGMTESEIGALKKRSIHGSGTTFAAQGAKFLIKLTTQILIARLLLPADYGLVAMVAPILSLSYLMGELGLGQAIVLQSSITPADVSSLFWFSLLLNSLSAAALMLVAPAFAWLYHEPRTVQITLALAPLLPITGLAAQHIALLNRQMRFTALAVLDVIPPAIALAAALTAARSGWGYWSLIAFAAAESISTVVVAWSVSGWRPSRPTRHPQIGRLIRIGGDITGCNLAGYVATSLDNILLGTFKGSVALGLYDRGRKLVMQPLQQLLTPVGRVAIPLLMRLRGDPCRYKGAYLDAVRMMMLAATPGILFTITMARPLIVFLLGPRWEGVAPVFSWLCLGGLASPLYSSMSWLFTTQDQTRRQVAYATQTSVISVLAFVVGLPWGPVGVAAGAALSFVLISTPLVCWGATKRGIVTLFDLIAALLPFVISGGVTAAVLELVQPCAPVHGAGLLAMSVVLSYGTFVGVLLCLPGGQPIVRRAWHFGTLLTRGQGAAT